MFGYLLFDPWASLKPSAMHRFGLKAVVFRLSFPALA
jgi:hypothetical protein